MGENELFTIPEIAVILGENNRRVAYVVLKYRIEPKRLVGRTKMFNGAQIARIKRGCYNLQLYKED